MYILTYTISSHHCERSPYGARKEKLEENLLKGQNLNYVSCQLFDSDWKLNKKTKPSSLFNYQLQNEAVKKGQCRQINWSGTWSEC